MYQLNHSWSCMKTYQLQMFQSIIVMQVLHIFYQFSCSSLNPLDQLNIFKRNDDVVCIACWFFAVAGEPWRQCRQQGVVFFDVRTPLKWCCYQNGCVVGYYGDCLLADAVGAGDDASHRPPRFSNIISYDQQHGNAATWRNQIRLI